MAEFRRVHHISIDKIRPNPNQPRRRFEPEALRQLSQSIRQFGILQPLTVRKLSGGFYELVAGERRLRAAKLAGLSAVPCLLRGMTAEESALLALVENIQRRDLHYLEEAAALERLIRQHGLSQEEAARRIGRSQSAVANKLRLLKLSPACTELLLQHDLTERHARAVLALPGEEERLSLLRQAGEKGWTVARLEEQVEQLLQQEQKKKTRSSYIIKDVRIFLNTIYRGMDLMRHAGVEAQWGREDTEEEIRLLIRIPKRSGKAS